MEYKIVIKDGYIFGVGEVPSGGNINKEEFDRMTEIINQMPEAPDGFYYCLKENLEWELCELKINPENEIATEDDYQEALESLVVKLNA